MNDQSTGCIKGIHKAFGDTTSFDKVVDKDNTRNSSPCTEYISTELCDEQSTDQDIEVIEESVQDYSSTFTSDLESGIDGEKEEPTIIASVSSTNSKLPKTSGDISKPLASSQPSTKKSRSPSFATKAVSCRKTTRNSINSLSNSTSASCLYCESTPTTRKYSQGNEPEFGVAELAEALRQLSRDARFRSIRPLWQDPNSRPLPSDEAASVEAMLKEYNQILIKAASEQRTGAASPKIAVRRPYHSTLNRWRQQERIQMENFFMANRLRNIRPSPEISREVLLKRHKQYFVTPITAQSLNHLPSSVDNDASNVSISSWSRLRCSSARPTSQSSSGIPRPLTGISSFGRVPSARTLNHKFSPAMPHSSRPPSRRASGKETPRSQGVLDSLNSVKQALYEQRMKGKL
ncbi:hypothetical protein Aperf_G00000062519 [Anoplocephala perfoliata]